MQAQLEDWDSVLQLRMHVESAPSLSARGLNVHLDGALRLCAVQGAWDESKCDCCDEFTLSLPKMCKKLLECLCKGMHMQGS